MSDISIYQPLTSDICVTSYLKSAFLENDKKSPLSANSGRKGGLYEKLASKGIILGVTVSAPSGDKMNYPT